MTRRLLFSIFGAIAYLYTGSSIASSQPATAGDPPLVSLSTLSRPLYPPLARQARIMGDVAIKLVILPDGRIESAEVVSGHPLLKQAALDSANKSTFACKDCTGEMTYLLTYTFGFRDDGPCPQAFRKRSLKCLGLWRCGGWYSTPALPTTIGESTGRIIILADSACVETEEARSK